jgi:HPt (histidine-containing phosphotransfer) domain-containing protein
MYQKVFKQRTPSQPKDGFHRLNSRRAGHHIVFYIQIPIITNMPRTATIPGGVRIPLLPAPKPDSLRKALDDLRKQKERRLATLTSSKGKEEVQDALIDIHSAAKGTRISGAKKLAELKPDAKEAFVPMLDALKKEDEPEARLWLLKALKNSLAESEFDPSFKAAAEPLDKIIFGKGDEREKIEAIISSQFCIADNREDISRALLELSGRISSFYGDNSALSTIASALASSIERD